MPTLDQLKTKYLAAKKAYYNDPNGKTNMSDEAFDALEDLIKEKDPKWKGFKAGAPVFTKTKRKLPVPMFSLDKVKTAKQLVGFQEAYDGDAVIMDKLDGSSLELGYIGGKPDFLITRGNGTIGGDVSYLIPHLRGIPQSISTKKRVIIRCEGLFTKAAFEKYKDEFDAARNAASGVLNRKDVHKAVRDLQVVALSVLEPNMSPSKGLTWLKAQQFRTVAWRSFPMDRINVEMLDKLLAKRKESGQFQIDGLVIAYDKVNQIPRSGNPDWSVAFKSNVSVEDAPVTTVKEVHWKVSPHGYIIPRIEFEPLTMDGAKVKFATAFNGKYVEDNKLGPGAQVKIVRSGDIIPYIVEVTKQARKASKPPASLGPIGWDKTETNWVLDDPKNNAEFRAQKIARTFQVLDVDYLRGKTVDRLIAAGFDNVTKILKADADDFLRVEGFKEASANKLFQAIHEKVDKGFPLTQLMDASGGFPRGVGQTRLDSIAEHHNLMQLATMDKDELIELISAIPGFQEKSATLIATGLPKFAKWVRITGLKVRAKAKVKTTSQKLAGQYVSFTGFRDKNAETTIQENGGQVGNFGGKTTVLLVSPTGKASGKADIARGKGIPVMTLDQFYKKFKL